MYDCPVRGLPPLRALLDPREAYAAAQSPLEGSVNIPLAEMSGRLHELPPRSRMISVVGDEPTGLTAVALLQAGGRSAEYVGPGRRADVPCPGRLWSPSSFVEEIACKLPPGRALEMGCGSGRNLAYLAALGWSVSGFDVLPDALERARDLIGRYAPGAAAQLVLKDCDRELPLLAEADIIVCSLYLPRGLLPRCASLMAPGACLLVEVLSSREAGLEELDPRMQQVHRSVSASGMNRTICLEARSPVE